MSPEPSELIAAFVSKVPFFRGFSKIFEYLLYPFLISKKGILEKCDDVLHSKKHNCNLPESVFIKRGVQIKSPLLYDVSYIMKKRVLLLLTFFAFQCPCQLKYILRNLIKICGITCRSLTKEKLKQKVFCVK